MGICKKMDNRYSFLRCFCSGAIRQYAGSATDTLALSSFTPIKSYTSQNKLISINRSFFHVSCKCTKYELVREKLLIVNKETGEPFDLCLLRGVQ